MQGNSNGYEVGYKKPPKQTQFKKGQSGNPRGHSKQRPNIQTLLSEELRRQLSFNEDGRLARDSKLRLMVKQAINKAVVGDFRPLMYLGKLQSWLQAVDNQARPRKFESAASEKEAAERYQELVRADLQATGLDRWIKV